MAKFYGAIGYVETQETKPDVFDEVPIERMYKGELIRNTRRTENQQAINDSINISNQISILADPYARNHIFAMRYVKWMGTAWKISDVSVEYPRLVLSIGGIYHGRTAQSQ